MSTFLKNIKIFTIAFLFAFPIVTYADVAVSVPSTGSASAGSGGVIDDSTQGTVGNATINWNITQSGSNYNYLYTINFNPSDSGAISFVNFWLGIGTNTTLQNLLSIDGPTESIAGPVLATGDTISGIPANIYSIGMPVDSLSSNTVSFSILANVAPTWGNFAVNGFTSNDNYFLSYNSNFLSTPDANTTDFTGWIPIIGNSVIATPEPATFAILGSLLLAIAFIKRKSLMHKI